MTPSARALWQLYSAQNSSAPAEPLACFHFCDNQADADICADLVARGIKRATATSLAELALAGQPQPKPGDTSIVTDWAGNAVAIIRTVSVDIKRFEDVDAAFAQSEGEGDGSLEWWRAAHLAYYRRVLDGTDVVVDGNLPIACETFARIF